VRAQELIQRKRDGAALEPEEIGALVRGYTAGEIPDYQMAAFCMAVFFRGMAAAETAALTDAMLRSGDVLDLSDIPGPKVDKHSTGGVGDKVSLTLAPIAAACGVRVPMISGRGLGHTGGTLDKLEAIPGFRIGLSVEEFRAVRGPAARSSVRPSGSRPPIASSTRCATSRPRWSRSRSSRRRSCRRSWPRGSTGWCST
jgi:thymidine phosphorylase